MMTNNERNAKAILNRLVENKNLRPESMSWLTAALDPWHDTPIENVQGIPDRTTGKSVVFSLTQEYSISKANSPVALPAGNWSFRVSNYPILSTVNVSSGILRGNCFGMSNNNYIFVPVQVGYAQDGAAFSPTAIGGLPGNSQGVQIPPAFTKGTVKLLSMGIEIINTTSSLYKQGLVTAVRSNQAPYAPATMAVLPIADASNRLGHASYVTARAGPMTLAEMATYPNITQYEAGEGYYSPVIMNPSVAPNDYPNPVGLLVLDTDLSGGPIEPAGVVVNGSRLVPTTLTGNTTTALAFNDIPVIYSAQTSTVIFSGLSEQTTCTLRVRFICERFPTDAEPDILVLATPTAPYDPLALEIYSQVVHDLPACVMFSENPKGEWWAELVGRIAQVAGPMIAMIPHPYAKGIGAATTIAGAASENYAKAKRKNRRAKNKKEAYGKGMRKDRVGDIVPVKQQNKKKKKKKTGQTLPGNPGPKSTGDGW